jgi:hypothetical protein
LFTTANGAQSPDDRCYNRLRLPGVPIRHIAHHHRHAMSAAPTTSDCRLYGATM